MKDSFRAVLVRAANDHGECATASARVTSSRRPDLASSPVPTARRVVIVVGRAAVAPVPRALSPRGEQRFERPQRAVAFGDGARAAGRRGARERLEDALKRGPRRQGGHPVALRVVRRRRRDPRARRAHRVWGDALDVLRAEGRPLDDGRGARVGFGGIGGGYEDAGEPAPRGHPAVAAHPGCGGGGSERSLALFVVAADTHEVMGLTTLTRSQTGPSVRSLAVTRGGARRAKAARRGRG